MVVTSKFEVSGIDREGGEEGRRGRKSRNLDGWRGWQNERNAKRARPVVTWKGPQWLSTGRTHLIHDLISHPVTNQHAGATTRDVRFKHFYPSANNKAVNVIDTDKGDSEYRFDFTSLLFPSLLLSFVLSALTTETRQMTLRRKSVDSRFPPFVKVYFKRWKMRHRGVIFWNVPNEETNV